MATQQMSVTMTGFAASHPTRHGSIAKLVTFRMASTPRWNDNGEWRDGGTLFIEVQCWGRLGDHVMQSVVKGAPLVIAGRMTSYSYKPENNARTGRDGEALTETIWRVTASNIGLDLSHSPSTWSLRDRVKDASEGSADGVSGGDQEAGESLGGYSSAVTGPAGPAAGSLPGTGVPGGGVPGDVAGGVAGTGGDAPGSGEPDHGRDTDGMVSGDRELTAAGSDTPF